MDIFEPFRKIPAGRLRASLEKENVLLAFIRNAVEKLRRTSGKIKKLPAGETYPCVTFNLHLLRTAIH